MTNFKKLVYLAYGSNLNKAQMAQRCPAAKSLGAAFLPGHRLVFKGVADIIPADGFNTPVGLWEITAECERALDRYESYPNLYRKKYWHKDGTTYMAYVMNNDRISRPPQMYYDAIKSGYDDFDLDVAHLEVALQHSLDNGTSNGYVSQQWG